VAVIVDSLGPRHLPNEDYGVCAGWRLWGRERAGDVLVVLDEVRRLPYVDSKQIFLIGWSHGGWSIMDLLALDPPHRLPTSLSAAPGNLDGLAGVLLIYPYLGFGALARSQTIHKKVPILMLLSGADTVAPTDASLQVANRLQHDGLDVTTHLYQGRDHCWDQSDLPPGGKLVYDAAVTADAHTRVAAFLERVRAGKK
jgi:dienelactone hydrolase